MAKCPKSSPLASVMEHYRMQNLLVLSGTSKMEATSKVSQCTTFCTSDPLRANRSTSEVRRTRMSFQRHWKMKAYTLLSAEKCWLSYYCDTPSILDTVSIMIFFERTWSVRPTWSCACFFLWWRPLMEATLVPRNHSRCMDWMSCELLFPTVCLATLVNHLIPIWLVKSSAFAEVVLVLPSWILCCQA